jgi:hypothetical protein
MVSPKTSKGLFSSIKVLTVSIFGKNILIGILGPRRARGVSRGWGWGPAPAGLRLRGPWLWQYKKIPVMISGPLTYAWDLIDFFNYSQNIRF